MATSNLFKWHIMVEYQSAAIPYRRNEDGELEVLLVTSRRRKRWVLPKGKTKRWVPPHTSAAREAFEEAGVAGGFDRLPVGIYCQRKSNGADEETELSIRAFPMRVIQEHTSWPEQNERQRAWLNVAAAIVAVQDHELSSILIAFEAKFGTATETS